MKTEDVVGGVVLGLFISMGIMLVLNLSVGMKSKSYWHRQIISNNCGQYNQTTGAFEWVVKEAQDEQRNL
jgi:hypothetical protein